jgi:outer membrane receptor protein involved in Fe transport
VNNPAIGIQGIPPAFTGTSSGYQFSGAQNFSGEIKVKEFFGEVLVPIFADTPLIQQFNINAAARWADYSGSGEIWSWKFGVDWSLTDEFRLRGTVSRDVRAGSLSERFDQQGQGASASDPFRGGETYAFGQTIGGNPNINPEEADTITAGFVYQPGFLEGFSLSADYYEIETAGLIAQLGTANIINQCFAGSQSQCANIERGDPAEDPVFGVGFITQVFNGFQNIGEAVVSGVDVEAGYRRDVDFFGGIDGEGESINFRVFYSYLEENSLDSDDDPATATLIERAGDVGLAFPRHKVTANISYSSGPLTVFLQERMIGSGKHSNQFNGVNAVEGIHINDNKVKAAYYTDLNVSWAMDQANGGSVELFANVNNLLDKDPPIRGAFFNFFGSTQQVDALHDLLGRRYAAGVRLRF